MAAHVRAVDAQLRSQLGRAPTVEELAREAGVPAQVVKLVAEAGRPHASLEAALAGDGDDGLPSEARTTQLAVSGAVLRRWEQQPWE